MLPRPLDDVGAAELDADAPGDPVLAGIEHVPLITLHHRHPIVGEAVAIPIPTVEVSQELGDDIWGRDEVSVEDCDELGARIGALEGDLESAAFEATSILAVAYLHPRVVSPSFQDLRRLIGGVIGDDDLVVFIIERGTGGEEPVYHCLLVIER